MSDNDTPAPADGTLRLSKRMSELGLSSRREADVWIARGWVRVDGRVVSESEWKAHEAEWLPSDADRAFVSSLMGRVVEPGKFANWIAPPAMGINRQPVDFEYVRFG